MQINSLKEVVDIMYPIGSIYMSINDTDPSTLFGGKWESWGAGRVPVGVNSADTDFNLVEKTGGEKTHKLTTAELAQHSHGMNSHTHSIPELSGSAIKNGMHAHNIGATSTATKGSNQNRVSSQDTATTDYRSSESGEHTHTIKTNASTTGKATGNTANSGSNTAHNNLQPYITCYMFKRVE